MLQLSKLKICYLAGTLGQGGAERQLFYTVQVLAKAGAAVRVFTLERHGYWEEPIRECGVKLEWVGRGSRLQRVWRIVKALKQVSPDLFLAQHFYTNAYVALAGLLHGCPAVGAVRSSGHFDLLKCGAIGGRINLRLPKILAANSKSAIRYAAERGVPQHRLYFLPNVVDTERFRPANAVAKDQLTLLAVGRLTREKRLDRFLRLVHRIRTQHGLNARGLIVGTTRPEENLRPALEAQAAALGLLPDALEFRNSTPNMPEIFQEADICVLTSDHEGTPNVLLEAMASGLPVVATKVGGVPEIVSHGRTGLLVDREDSQGLTAATANLLRDAELRLALGARARIYVEETHSLHRQPVHLTGLYEFALSTKPCLRNAQLELAS
jgi:glycosyltransferase involved in cell wall biosynthesis